MLGKKKETLYYDLIQIFLKANKTFLVHTIQIGQLSTYDSVLHHYLSELLKSKKSLEHLNETVTKFLTRCEVQMQIAQLARDLFRNLKKF